MIEEKVYKSVIKFSVFKGRSKADSSGFINESLKFSGQ